MLRIKHNISNEILEYSDLQWYYRRGPAAQTHRITREQAGLTLRIWRSEVYKYGWRTTNTRYVGINKSTFLFRSR